MDYAHYDGIKELRIKDFLDQNAHLGEIKSIEKLRRFGDKGVLFCPFCQTNLILKAGDQREIHFSHKGKSCLVSNSYDVYIEQMERENQKRSVIKEFIYNELKGQEMFKKVSVEYGFVVKAEEKWRQLPDIIVQTANKEIAVNVITNIHEIGDKATVKKFIKRDRFLKEKGLEVIWFVEDRELADDLDNRVIHLWEAEYNLAMKTEQDEVWDALLHQLDDDDMRFYDVMGYRARKELDIDCRSLYYVHLTNDQVLFSVYRVILDEKMSPYRSFAVNKGYKIELASALTIRDTILLSNPERDDQERLEFKKMFEERKKHYRYQVNETSTYHTDRVQFNQVTPFRNLNMVRQDNPQIDYHNNIDPVELLNKIKYFTITAFEAKQMSQFIRNNSLSLEDYGLTVSMIKSDAYRALGYIEDKGIREWLVEIIYL